MKKILSFVFVCLLSAGYSLHAAPVSGSRALDIAKKIFAAQPATKSGSGQVKLIWDGEDVATKGVQPAFYVFGRDGGGFVIISGDDNVTPVLAISDHNEFKVEGMPDNVRWWMDRMKAYVRASASQTPEVQARWAKYVGTKSGDTHITGEVTDKVEKLTPEWDQGRGADVYYFGREVFNVKCPKVGDELTYTGCVATALGEVLTYQSGQAGVTMPAAGQGTVGGYEVSEGNVAPPAYELGTVYLWDQLRTLTGTKAIQQAIADGKEDLLENLAQLLADIGAVMHAGYGLDGTGAYSADVPGYMPACFGFNKAAYCAYAKDFSSHQWVVKLKAELDLRPIYYWGIEGEGGHAFVFDGYGTYEGADVFHVNFGWSGSNNGYYFHDNMDTGGGAFGNCGAVFDFYPAPESVYPKIIRMDAPGMAYVYDDGSGLEPVPPLGEGGSRLSISGWFGNGGLEPISGTVKLVLKDKAGNIKAEEDQLDFELEPRMGWRGLCFFDLYFNVPFVFGDYLEFYYSTDDARTKWEPMHLGGNPSQIVSVLPIYPSAFIQTADSYSQNDWFAFALKNHDSPYAGTVWTFTDPSGKAVTRKQSDFEFQFNKKGTWKVEAAVAPAEGDAVVETIVTYIKVN